MDLLARMHTAEHLLSAVMRIYYRAPRNLELHLGEKKTKCDYEPQVEITPGDFARIEQLVNREIAADHQVTEIFLDRATAEMQHYDLWKVPAEARRIRIVKIGELDAQPCSGRHVHHTAQIGKFRLLSHEFRDNGRLRLRFKVVEAGE